MLDRIDIKYFKLAIGQENIGKESDIDIVARCPICGDSQKNKRKKRLHLYIKSGVTNVNCFNGDCAVHNKTMYSFLREFYPTLLNNFKQENFGNTIEKLANGSIEEDVFANLNVTKPEVQKKTADIFTQDLSKYLKDISEVPEAIKYIEKRGFEYSESKYGKWYFGFQDLQIGGVLYKITGAIVIPLYYNNEMYGFYSRSIYDKTFYTYMDNRNIGYKIWNWFNIDHEKPVYIYEGIFDAISGSLDNSIASMGAKIPQERVQELKNPIFVLDNDRTGLLNSLDYAKKGFDIYIQPERYQEKDMNELMLNHPNLDIASLINENIFSGIVAEVRLKNKL